MLNEISGRKCKMDGGAIEARQVRQRWRALKYLV